MEIQNTSKQTCLAKHAREACTFSARLKGLLGTLSFPEGNALILPHCRSVHMIGMRYAIDLIFVDHSKTIIRSISAIKPWSISPYVSNAAMAIELPAGTIGRTFTEIGDTLSFIEDRS